ncbi:ABC transporter ATP-binding protein [Candidatus Bipolaricaulota bacterium]|nr:ABC transporter ATP-binding protein [Candidatus Bipolaricaulota bacterium]
MPVVEAQGLGKRYNGFQAVHNLDLTIDEGEIFGLLGPNGSGKTTTILMLLGLTEPTSGSVSICGYDPVRNPIAVKRRVGYLPENVGFYDDLTARENLRFVARLNGMRDRDSAAKIDELISLVGLEDAADRPVRTFSRGMRQRLGIADVLIKDPEFVILDEPTSGIDPEGAIKLLDMIVELRNSRGMTVMLSSHLLHQVQRICDRVGIMHRGEIVAKGTVGELGKGEEGQEQLELQVDEITPLLLSRLREIEGISAVEPDGDRIRLTCTQDVRAEVARTVVEHGASLLELRRPGLTLEEIYLRYFQE